MSEDTQILEPAAKKQKLDNAELEDVNNLEHDFTQDIDTSEAPESCPVNEKYDNYVTIEELQKLREFQVLDEVKSNDEDSNAEESDSSDGKSEGLPEEELEKMLDEGLPEDFKSAPKPKEKAFITRQKVVLEEKGINHFEVLPLDWLMARHYSGMPIYMHRSTRVCTLAKPYFLGKGNTRRHDIPISAIPCLAYRKALEEERKQKQIDKDIDDQIKHGTWQQTADKNKTNHETQDKGGKASENRKTGSGKNSEVEVSKCPVNSVNDRQSATQTNEAQKSPVNSSEDSRERNEDATLEHDNIIAEDSVQEDIENATDLTHNSGDISNCSFNNTGSIQDSKESGKDEVQTENNVEDITNESETPKCPFNNEIEKHEDVVNNDKSLSPNDNIEAVTKDEDTTGTNNIDSEGKVNDVPLNRQPVVLPGGIVMPPPRVETVSTSWKTQHLTQEQVNEYCRKLFKFKTVSVMHFKRWADRRKYTKARKTLQYPTLPEGTKLITIPAQPATGQDNGGNKSTKRDWVMNMNGRSYLSVFHEYVRRALQKQPVYEFKQLENAATPYQATVYIGGMQYGVGHGSSKRSAKSAAARASIHILIPEMGAELETATPNPTSTEPDFSFFDYVGIEDPRITEFCAATCEPSPHAILRTCLLRNFGAGDRHIHTEMKKLEYQKIELTMKVGKHTATVVCKNKKTAKQRASQSILQALHPHVRSWGSLLRLYGSRSVKSCKEKKLEEQQITLLQDSARHNEPNYAVLEKLRNEMIKLRERDEAVVPIGTLLVKDDLPTHSGSNLNNVDL